MSISGKIFLVVIVVVFGLITAFIAPITAILTTNYNELDNHQAKENTLRVFNFIEEQINTVARSATDWSRWDDTVLFIAGADQGYLDEEIPNAGIPIGLNVNIMGFINDQRQLMHQITVDLQYQRVMDLPPEFAELAQHSYTNREVDEIWAIRGLTLLDNTATIVAFAPVTDSDRVPPASGTLIFGKFLDTYAINQLNEALQLETKLYLVQEPLSVAIQAILDDLEGNYQPELPLDLYLVDDTTPQNIVIQIKQHKLESQSIQLRIADKFIVCI
jgi:sensor domain CHASE-containing protein